MALIKSSLKPISVAIAYSMAALSLVAITAKAADTPATGSNVPTTSSATVVPNSPNSGMTDEQVQAYFKQHGRLPGLKDMVWPNEKLTRSAGRFGELRGSKISYGY